MPCSDGGYDHEQLELRKQERARQEEERKLTVAVLCGICTALEAPGAKHLKGISQLPKVLDKVDWEEVGFTRSQFAVWWDIHKTEDRERREREDKARIEKQKAFLLRQQALAKLSQEEKEALGLALPALEKTLRRKKP